MWHLFIESITDIQRVITNILVFVIPYTVYKVNQRLHKKGDPPWKQGTAGEGRSAENEDFW